jgi:type I restriction enzyme S subunit
MSHQPNQTTTQSDAKAVLVPRLRFPEFRDEGAWETVKLGSVASISIEKVGDNACVPMSITSGVGLVSQEDKFGRIIAGDSYKNYLLLKPKDFAYNKSATKEYPEGFLTLYSGSKLAAVPNSIFTCFRVNGESPVPTYLNYLFLSNLHGQWLRRFIQVGARAHGSLSINDSDLMALPVPLPTGASSVAEQRKIADCLLSLDELIAAQARKVDALKSHKKSLMRRLFPCQGEARPLLRFPEFQEAPDWEISSLGRVFETTSGGTPSRSEAMYWNGDIPWITTSMVDFCVITEAEAFISEEGLKSSSAKLLPKGTVLIAMYGQGKTRGQVAMLGLEAATNQACAALLQKAGIDPYFAFMNLTGQYEEFRKLSNSGGQENLSQRLIREFPFAYPLDKGEQLRIADCFTSVDVLISAATQELDTLKTHKKGLMQQLFPSSEEVAA